MSPLFDRFPTFFLTNHDLGEYFDVVCIDRFPARPYIKEGFLHNVTVLVNSTATLECRTISDLEPHIEWIKFHIVDNTNPNIPENITKLEVPITVSIDHWWWLLYGIVEVISYVLGSISGGWTEHFI